MNSTDPIPVYQNQYRIKDTFHLSMQALKNRQNLLIFPEQKGVTAEGFQHIFTLNTGFLYLARQYFRELRESLRIVPVAINPNLPAIAVGTAVQFDPNQPYEQEKKRLVRHIMEQIEMLYDPEASHAAPTLK
jgi:1-acyl-sn-glycerol-3-phosphate acyltransferase